MEEKDLHRQLIQLQNKLKESKSLDKNSREILKKLMDDIQVVLERSEEEPSEGHNNLLENLKESATHFEASHPEISESMHIVIHTLSNMGI